MDTNFLYGGNWATFFIAAIIVSFASIFLSYIIDTVGKRTKFSGSLFAGTIVALISSLPELTMSLVNIFTDQKEGYALALGNLMGGNIFRTMIFAALSLLFIYSMRKAKTTFAQFFLVTIQIILTIGFLFNYMFYDKYTSEWNWPIIAWIGIDILAIVFYIVNLFVMMKTDKNDTFEEPLVFDETKSKYNFIINKIHAIRKWLMKTKIRNVWFSFIVISFVIIGCSLMMGLNMDWIIASIVKDTGNNSESFLASIFGGMVTSIPEIITIITLLKIGDVDAAVSDVLGSNIFSCLIIGVEELISGKDVGVATTNWDLPGLSIITFWFIIELVLILSALIIIYIYRVKKIKHNHVYFGIIGTILILCIGTYIMYILQNINIIPNFLLLKH